MHLFFAFFLLFDCIQFVIWDSVYQVNSGTLSCKGVSRNSILGGEGVRQIFAKVLGQIFSKIRGLKSNLTTKIGSTASKCWKMSSSISLIFEKCSLFFVWKSSTFEYIWIWGEGYKWGTTTLVPWIHLLLWHYDFENWRIETVSQNYTISNGGLNLGFFSAFSLFLRPCTACSAIPKRERERALEWLLHSIQFQKQELHWLDFSEFLLLRRKNILPRTKVKDKKLIIDPIIKTFEFFMFKFMCQWRQKIKCVVKITKKNKKKIDNLYPMEYAH